MRRSDAKLVRSLLLHVVGKEYKLPPALKECKLTKWERRNMGSSLRGHFLRIAVAVARGASRRCVAAEWRDVCRSPRSLLTRNCCRRDELRAAFPTLQLSREAVHAFARMPRRARVPSGCDTYALYATPFGVLRAAQLMALGFDMQTAFLTLPSLLPPEPCADAGEEKLLLASARFLLQHGAFREARDCMDDVAARGIPHNAYYDIYSEQFAAQLQDAGYPIARAYDEADSLQPLADIGFLLHTRARAAEAAHTPQRDAFSFRGRTLASLLHLAMQHRRDAVLASAVVNGGRPRQDPPLWRLPLAWDADCEAMLAPHIDAVFRERSSLPSREWAGSLRTDVPGMSRLRGRWHMRELHRQRDVLLEGKQQHNCLSYRKHIWEHEMYWSLRFTPDADAVLALDGSTRTEVERVVAAERHTVCLQGARVTGLAGPCNAAPTRAAARALARWAPTGVDLGRFGGARRRPGRQR